MIHYELIFIKGVTSMSRFTLLHMEVQVMPASLVEKKRSLFLVLPLLLSQKSVDHFYGGLYVDSLFCSTDLLVFLSS